MHQPLSKAGQLYFVVNQFVAIPLALYGAWEEYDERDPRDVRPWEMFDGLAVACASELAELPFEAEEEADFDFERFYEQETAFYDQFGYDHELFMLDAAALGLDDVTLKVWSYAYLITYTLEAYFDILRTATIQDSPYAGKYDAVKGDYEDGIDRMLIALRADLADHNPMPAAAQAHVSDLARQWVGQWRTTVEQLALMTLN